MKLIEHYGFVAVNSEQKPFFETATKSAAKSWHKLTKYCDETRAGLIASGWQVVPCNLQISAHHFEKPVKRSP